MALKTPSPPIAVTIHLAEGEDIQLRRCGMLPDVFSDIRGQIYRLESVSTYLQAGYPVIKYLKNTLMVKHLVADAWKAGWEEEGHQLIHIDGDNENVHAHNLAASPQGRGRPRNSAIYKRLQAVNLYRIHPDAELIAEELGMTKEAVLHAVKQSE